ncbi:hypothetical protein [Stieleria varia]|uniref:DUF2493 domain-containing protein n=1 Tax=Stieleria varia TaxID=2528005 RepID=A0A5C6B2G8_9BACT|nr:hypothetical protein [Stieleria varia]TWU06515.1 hypothetical protein Pla52n_22370 [Stieleria varia]
MKIGFTGSRNGMTEQQRTRFRQLLNQTCASEAHHGDCVGADADFHAICVELGVAVVVHPPSNSKSRAICSPVSERRPPLPYLQRNQTIVRSTVALIAAVSGPERVRSGTWATIRFARTLRRPIFLVDAAGHVTNENDASRLLENASTKVIHSKDA